MARHWAPCRVCGAEHTNPMSSSICAPCGMKEHEARMVEESTRAQTYEATPFDKFMCLTEDERWERVFDRLFSEEAA